MTLVKPSLRSFCGFVDFAVSSVWHAKIKNNKLENKQISILLFISLVPNG
jgi:hypothetical protein